MTLFRLDGKRALVTGGTRGIGLAAARQLRELGAEVTVASRSEANVQAAAQQLGARGLVADVSRPEEIERLMAQVGPLDILVINAGGPPPSLPSQVSEDGWEKGFQTTFMSAVRLADGALPGMRERGWGRIIAITSQSVQNPVLMLPVSNAMRAAVTNHLKTLAMEVARDGVTCNTVAPGLTATERLQNLYKPDEAETIKKNIPAQRFGQPEEVAAAIAFLATREAAYITGQEILVDGGNNI